MRIVPNKFLITLLGCLTGMFSLSTNVSTMVANPNPPPPTPPPPGLPIDGGVAILLLVGLALAFYKFQYKLNIKKTLK